MMYLYYLIIIYHKCHKTQNCYKAHLHKGLTKQNRKSIRQLSKNYIAKPKTDTIQYIVLFSQRTVHDPSVVLSQ